MKKSVRVYRFGRRSNSAGGKVGGAFTELKYYIIIFINRDPKPAAKKGPIDAQILFCNYGEVGFFLVDWSPLRQ